MGNKDDRTYYQGVVYPDDRVTVSALQAKGAGATDSAYTQAGARTGTPVPSAASSLSLSAGGSQSEDGYQEIRLQRAGLPVDGGATFAWREATSGDWYGQDAPVVACDWAALSSAASAIYRVSSCDAVTLSDGTYLAVIQQAVVSPGVVHLRSLASGSTSWTSITMTPQQSVAQLGPALCALPDGSVLMLLVSEGQNQVDTYRSTDQGATWTLVSQRVLDVALTHGDTRRLAAAYSGGQVLLMVCTYDSGGTYEGAQYVSADVGATFQQVEGDFLATSTYEPRAFAALAIPGGGFAVAWMDDSGGTYRVARVATAEDNVAEAASTAIGAWVAGEPSATLWADGSRALWALTLATLATGTERPMLYTSADLGATWSSVGALSLRHDRGYRLHSFAADWHDGALLMVTRFDSALGTGSYQDYSVCAARFGGYSTHTMPTQANPFAYSDGEYAGPAMWTPGVLPNPDWVLTTAGSPSVSNRADYLQIATAGGSDVHHYGWTATDARATAVVWEGWFNVTAGGSTSTDDVSVKLQWSDNSTYQYRITIRLTASHFLVYDEVATANVGAATPFRTSGGWHKIRVFIDTDDNISTFYADQEYPVRWQAGPSGTLTDSGVAASSVVEWGHRAVATATSQWRGVSWWLGSAYRYTPSSSASPAASWSNPEDVRGRPLSYLPQHHYDGVTISAQGGPGYEGDTWTLSAQHDYAVAQMLPRVNPSPSSGWRSTADNVEVLLVLDLEDAGTGTDWGSSSIGVVALNANIAAFHVDGYNGSTWTTILTARSYLGFDSLHYTRSGRVVQPDTGTNHSSARYLYQHAAAGDTFDFNDGSTWRKIRTNGAGAWRDDTTQRVRLELDGIDGTEPTSGSGAAIWRKDFGGVIHNVTDYQKIRIRIPAHETADGDYRIGSLVIGPLVVFGTPYDLGYSNVLEFNDELITGSSGRRRLSVRGKPRRSFEMAWANTAVDLQGIDAANPDPDYVTLDGSTPVAARHDTSRQVAGLVQRAREDGVPIVLLPRLTTGAGYEVCTGRERVLYARPVSGIRIDNVLGYESTNEAERLNTVTLEEEV